jgi:dephospho-CoA kinase
MIRLGITGVIGSGKSQVARRLRDLGVPVIESDDVVHEAYGPGTNANRQVVEEFGDDVLDSTGSIDRRALAAVVFSDPGRRKRLESIIWPEVRRVTEAWLRKRELENAEIVAVVTPLLFESGRHGDFDHIWLVEAPEETLFERLEGRGFTPEQARARLDVQWSQTRRLQAATSSGKPFTRIVNDSDLEALDKRVTAALDRL